MKINLAIDCLDSSAMDTMTTLYSFLSKNEWFDGKVYIVVPNSSLLSSKTVLNLFSIWKDLEIIDVSADPNFLLQVKIFSNNSENLRKILAIKILSIPDEKILMISSGCLFINGISNILGTTTLTFPTNTNGKIVTEVFYKNALLEINEKIFASSMNLSLLTIASLITTIKISKILGEKSSQFQDKIFIKKKSIIKDIDFIYYDTFRRDAAKSSKINQIWLQHRNVLFNTLKKPIFRSGLTLAKSNSKNLSLISEEKMNILNNSNQVKNIQQNQNINRRLTRNSSTRSFNKKSSNLKNSEILSRYMDGSTHHEIILNSSDSIPNTKEISLSVIIPYFRAGDIGWIPFESLIRQVNVDFNWELVIIEEDFENPFGIEKIKEYSEKLQKVGCSRIKYVSLKEWIPLSAKWYFLINECSSTSKVVAMSSSDIYCSKNRLYKQYHTLINSNKNWYKLGGNIVYDISLNSHVKLFSMSRERTDTCSAAASMELMKKIPLANIKSGVDGWRFNILKPFITFYYDDSMDLQWDTININGLNNLSLNRTSRVKEVKPPFQRCCTRLESHIPIEIVKRLIDCKKYINSHAAIRNSSKINLKK